MALTYAATAWLVADVDGFGHMNGWGWGMAIIGWILLLLVAGGVAWLFVSVVRPSVPDRQPDPVATLGERYARG